MAKSLKILFMFIALGFYIIPKQILFANHNEISCCGNPALEMQKSSKDKSEMPCHKSEKGDCSSKCSSCKICSTISIILYVEGENSYQDSDYKIQKKLKFSYITPEFSDIFSKIWQPPKIS